MHDARGIYDPDRGGGIVHSINSFLLSINHFSIQSIRPSPIPWTINISSNR